MRFAWRFLGVFAIIGSLTSCSLLFKVRSDKVIVLTWLKAPTIDVEPFNQIPDLGLTTVTAFFAGGGFNPQPISGAFTAFFGRGQQFVMTERNPEGAPGIYLATSFDDPERGLPYDADPNRRFGMKACLDKIEDTGCVGEEFTLTRIRAAPEIDKASMSFDPPLLPPTFLKTFDGAVALGSDLKVIFPEPTDDFQYHPIVSVMGPTAEGVPGLVFNSLPMQGPDIVKFITESPPREITIPGDRFAQPGPYMILAATARLNLDSSDNVLIGAAVAGALTAFFVEVAPTVDLPDGITLPPELEGGIPNIPGGFEIPAGVNIPGLR